MLGVRSLYSRYLPGVACQLGNVLLQVREGARHLLAPRRPLCHFHHHHWTGVRFRTHFFLPTLEALICAFFSHRNHGSNFEQEKARLEDGGDKLHSAEDEEKAPDTRSEDNNEKS